MHTAIHTIGFPGGSDGKASACNSGDPDSIPGLGRSPGEGNGNPLQYPCLVNPMDRGAWQATVHGVAKSGIRLSDFTLYIKEEINQEGLYDTGNSTQDSVMTSMRSKKEWVCVCE